MDTCGPAAVLAADLHHQHRMQFRVLLVLGVVNADPQLVPGELARRVALLAGVARRTQVVHRRRDRRRIKIECHRDQLPAAGDLRLHEPVGSRTDVAVRARDARVRRTLVRRVFRLHDCVAGRAAELHRLHVLDALVGADREHDCGDRGHHAEYQQQLARVRLVQVDDRQVRWRLAVRGCLPCTLLVAPDADRNQHQAEGHQRRQHQVSDDSQVGTALETRQLHHEQRDEQHYRNRSECRADHAERAAGNHRKEIPDHA